MVKSLVLGHSSIITLMFTVMQREVVKRLIIKILNPFEKSSQALMTLSHTPTSVAPLFTRHLNYLKLLIGSCAVLNTANYWPLVIYKIYRLKVVTIKNLVRITISIIRRSYNKEDDIKILKSTKNLISLGEVAKDKTIFTLYRF